MYRIAIISMALWALCLFSGLHLDGWIHVLLGVSFAAVIAAVLQDRLQLMP